MFSSYNMKLFGNKLREIRKDIRLTQAEVSRITGINVDTLRKIENGSVVSKLETLELLSSLYKINLLEQLNHYKTDNLLMYYYIKLDEAIVSSERIRIQVISDIVDEIMNLENNELICRPELEQIKIFALYTKYYHCNKYECFEDAVKKLETAIILTNSRFMLDKLSDNIYSVVEIRILILMALCYSRLNKKNKAIELFRCCLDYLLVRVGLNNEVTNNLIIKLYYNLSYEYYLIHNDLKSYNYAKSGVEYCLNHKTHYLLALLYYRLGTAQYYLTDIDYKKTFKKAISLSFGLNDIEMVDYLSQKIKF